MAVRERRKKNRKDTTLGDSSFIEIRHTFGPVRKSVYKVLEQDEFGLSFLVPLDHGYFPVGTPLSYSLVKSDLSSADGAGFVRYYHPHNSELGESFYKIGVEISNTYRDLAGNNHMFRPQRFRLDGKWYDKCLSFMHDGKEYSFELLDISRYSAAFHYDGHEATSLPVSSILNSGQVRIDKDVIFDGSLTITRIYQDGGGKRRVVVEPRGRLFNVDSIEQYETISAAVIEAESLVERQRAFDAVDIRFKSAVADLRCLLEEYKRYLESPAFQSSDNAESLLAEVFRPFYGAMDEKVRGIDDIVKELDLSEEQHSLYRSYFQKHLLGLLLAAPANHRSYYKPEGYPGDYEIIRMIHEDGFRGQTLFGKLLHKYTTSFPLATVARKRTEYLARRILEFATERGEKTVEVFSIASGPAMEIDYLMKHHTEESGRISLTLLDREVRALQFSKDNLYAHRIRHGSRIQLDFLHKGLEDYIRESATNKESKKFDLIYAFGLFDYFDKDIARFVIKCLLPQLNPGGKLLVSNVSLDGHKYQTYAEYGFEWYLVYRSKQDMLDLARGLVKGGEVSVQEIENGSMKFLEIKG